MTELEFYQEEVCGIMPDFLNRTQDGERVVDEFTNCFAEKFALGQEQRCAVKIVLHYLDVICHTVGDFPEDYVGEAINLISHILIKDLDGVEYMLNDRLMN